MLVESSFSKRYHNTIFLLAKLSKAEIIFLLFLTQEMDPDNYVLNNHFIRDRFNDMLSKTGSAPYTESTIHKCFSKLSKISFLEKVPKKKGVYQINPAYFINGDDQNKRQTRRDQLIKERLERIYVNKTTSRSRD